MTPDMLLDGSLIAVLVGTSGLATRALVKSNGNSKRISSVEKSSKLITPFIATMNQWTKNQEQREDTRSRRMDTMNKGISELTRAVTDSTLDHGQRISRIEGKMNGANRS